MNAKKELLEIIGDRIAKCIKIALTGISYLDPTFIDLNVGYTEQEYSQFLEKMDFEYHDGYGRQEIEGVIWFTDGTWAERGEYDGSEWWEMRLLPDVTKSLKELKWE